jgi:hypothetical protein
MNYQYGTVPSAPAREKTDTNPSRHAHEHQNEVLKNRHTYSREKGYEPQEIEEK